MKTWMHALDVLTILFKLMKSNQLLQTVSSIVYLSKFKGQWSYNLFFQNDIP